MVAINKDLIAAILAALTAMAVVTGYICALPYIFRYSIDDALLKIRMLGFTVRRVRLSDITRVRMIDCSQTIPFSKTFRPEFLIAQRWGGYKAKEVVVEKRNGMIRKLIISPEEPETFVELLRKSSGFAGGIEVPDRTR